MRVIATNEQGGPSLAAKGNVLVTPGELLGVIDVGTQACRLLIATQMRGGGLRIIDAYSTSIGLGEGLAAEGRIGAPAMERALAALKICADRLKLHNVSHIRAIATEACRRASNSGELVERARAETGIDLVIVTPEEEARLAAAGCLPLIDPVFEGALIFDIGGGSTEMVLVRKSKGQYDIAAWGSVPVGVVTLADRHGGRRLAASNYAPMREEIGAAFAKMRMQLGPEGGLTRYHLLGTSGTLTTLAGIELGLQRYDRRRIDGHWMERTNVGALVQTIASRDFDMRAELPCVGEDRADLLLPGCAILDAIMESWPCARLRVADRGLREGLLVSLTRCGDFGN